MVKKFVIDGAELKCSMGTIPGVLMIPVPRNEQLLDKYVANIEDCKPMNIPPASFGLCKVTSPPKPCTPTCIQWLSGKFNSKAAGHEALLDNSVVACVAGGGMIEITDCGQGYPQLGITDAEGYGFVLIPEEGYTGKPFPVELGENPFGVDLRCYQFSGDPVNTATGNFVYEKEYLKTNGLFSMTFRIFYNAQELRKTSLGCGWVHCFEASLVKEGHKTTLFFDDGRREIFFSGRYGDYFHSQGIDNRLAEKGGNFIYQTHEGLRYIFNASGKLCRKEDVNANIIGFSYDEQNRLVEASNNSGTTFKFSYEGDRLSQVADNTGRTVGLKYKNDMLASVTDENNAEIQFAYDLQNQLVKIINPSGIEYLNNEYDKNRRITRQLFPDGGQIAYEYKDKENKLVMTEQNGNEIAYVHDEMLRSVATVYSDGTETYAYNPQNQRVLYTDKMGNETRYSYDTRGNQIKTVNPLGETVRTEYNDFNKPVKVTRCDNVVQQTAYNDRGNVSEVKDALKRVSKVEYDTNSRSIKLIAPDGSTNEVAYDERGNIAGITNAYGIKTTYKYDNLNRVIGTVDGNGNKTGYEYNIKGSITKVVNALGDERRYEYEAAEKVTKIVDFDGGVTISEYNDMGKLSKTIDQGGNETSLEYDLMWNLTSVTDPNGSKIEYSFNKLNRLVSTTDAEGNITKYEHDANGNVTAIITPNNARTEIEYDALNRITEVIEPCDAVTQFEYDRMGNLVEITDPMGNASKRVYDLAGQLKETKDQLGNSTKYTYSPLGQIETVTDAMGGVLSYEYYPGGRIRQIVLQDGYKETYEYDNNGNVIKVINGLGYETALAYDSMNRIVEIINPLGHSKKLAYDAIGNIREAVDENGNLTQYKYSLLGDIIEVIDALGYSTKYEYDKTRKLNKIEQYRLIDGTLAGLRQAEAQITSYERNRNYDVTAIHSPTNKTVHFKYDSMGNVISKLDEDGLETLFEYNLANKISKVAYADGKTVQFAYNPLKQLTEMKDWLGTTTIELDKLGRAEKVTDFEGKTVRYEWDALSRKDRITYPDASEVWYKYNNSGKLESVASATGETRYSYNALGLISERILPNKVSTRYEYNQTGLLASLIHLDGGDVLDQFNYYYDPVGNIMRIDKQRQGMDVDSGVYDYIYDPLGRLVSVLSKGNKKEYKYDSLGNRIASIDNRCEIKHQYNERNQLVRTLDGRDTEEYSYDGRGNMTKVLRNRVFIAEYLYGAANMMTEASVAGEGRVHYTYNGLQNRVKRLEQRNDPRSLIKGEMKKNDQFLEVRYILDLTLPYNNLIMVEGGTTQRYIRGNELIAADGADPTYYLQDHLGSPIRLIGGGDASDQVTPLAYDEFGKPLVNEAGNTNNPFGFTGYLREDISGLYYAQARYYNPLMGRFGGRDIYKGDISYHATLNEYSYCINNPNKYVDSNGEFFMLVAAAIGAVAGAVIGGVASAVTQVASGKSLDELDWKDIGRAAATGAVMGGVAGLTMGAAAAVLPAAGAAVGIGTSMALGLSGAAATTITTVATVAGGAAITTFGVMTASSIIEQGTSGYFKELPCPISSGGYSYNPIRDSVFGGNQGLYDGVYLASSFVTAGVIQIGTDNIGLMPQRTSGSTTGTPEVDSYKNLTKKIKENGSGAQAHHLNQDAAFRDVIPKDEGVCVGLEGNAFTEPGSPHYEAHNSLEGFWEPYRKGGASEGSTPTVNQYNSALHDSLVASGMSDAQAAACVDKASQQQLANNLSGSDYVPRVPGRIYQKGP